MIFTIGISRREDHVYQVVFIVVLVLNSILSSGLRMLLRHANMNIRASSIKLGEFSCLFRTLPSIKLSLRNSNPSFRPNVYCQKTFWKICQRYFSLVLETFSP